MKPGSHRSKHIHPPKVVDVEHTGDARPARRPPRPTIDRDLTLLHDVQRLGGERRPAATDTGWPRHHVAGRQIEDLAGRAPCAARRSPSVMMPSSVVVVSIDGHRSCRAACSTSRRSRRACARPCGRAGSRCRRGISAFDAHQPLAELAARVQVGQNPPDGSPSRPGGSSPARRRSRAPPSCWRSAPGSSGRLLPSRCSRARRRPAARQRGDGRIAGDRDQLGQPSRRIVSSRWSSSAVSPL